MLKQVLSHLCFVRFTYFRFSLWIEWNTFMTIVINETVELLKIISRKSCNTSIFNICHTLSRFITSLLNIFDLIQNVCISSYKSRLSFNSTCIAMPNVIKLTISYLRDLYQKIVVDHEHINSVFVCAQFPWISVALVEWIISYNPSLGIQRKLYYHLLWNSLIFSCT